MTKYALPGSVTLLIVFLILFSSFVKDNPSYIGIASKVTRLKIDETRAKNTYEKKFIPEIPPILLIVNADTIKNDSTPEIKSPSKKKPVKKNIVKKKKKKSVKNSPIIEERILIPTDTLVTAPAKADTLPIKIADENFSEPHKKKKKRKKFLIF